MQSNFRVSLLLQVRNDGLADKLGVAHHVQHLIILAVDERQLELVFRGVNAENSRTTLAVQAVDAVSLDACHIDGKIQCSDDAMVTTILLLLLFLNLLIFKFLLLHLNVMTTL